MMSVEPVDAAATDRTRALLDNLDRVRRTHVLFGHQDDPAYGVNWTDEPGGSDVKAVTGDYPAVYGWEIGGLELGNKANIDNVSFDRMREWMQAVYRRGGINTISWHMHDPVSGEGAWHDEPVVSRILPGGDAHETFKSYLDAFVAFNKRLTVTGPDGGTVRIPIIFRPWHEHTGDWFWWGTRHTDAQDYIELWRFTVDYLRDRNDVHNLLYAYAPDRSRIDIERFDEQYLYAYPGDEYVDIMGLDNYHDLRPPSDELPEDTQKRHFRISLESLVGIAESRGKVPAMTEGGQETLVQPDFWTTRILDTLTSSAAARRIAYLLVWRNANRRVEQREHFYAPYPGHGSADDFIEFYRHPLTAFEGDLPDMYSIED